MPLSAQVPTHVILTITFTEPGIKGNTATNATKPATTESGATINVPLFINEGDKIKVETTKAEGEKCPVCWKINKEPCERISCPKKLERHSS